MHNSLFLSSFHSLTNKNECGRRLSCPIVSQQCTDFTFVELQREIRDSDEFAEFLQVQFNALSLSLRHWLLSSSD